MILVTKTKVYQALAAYRSYLHNQQVSGAYLEGGRGGRGPPPPIAHGQEIFTLFKYPNIGKDTSKLHRNSTEIAEVVL